jgi:hypothetical protein
MAHGTENHRNRLSTRGKTENRWETNRESGDASQEPFTVVSQCLMAIYRRGFL